MTYNVLFFFFRNAPQPTPPSQLPKPPVRAHNPLKLAAKVPADLLLCVHSTVITLLGGPLGNAVI